MQTPQSPTPQTTNPQFPTPETTTSPTWKRQTPTPQTTATPELEAWLAALAWQYEIEREYYEACGGY